MQKFQLFPRLKSSLFLGELITRGRRQNEFVIRLVNPLQQQAIRPLTEHNNVFSLAATLGKAIRASIAHLHKDLYDSTVTSRLLKVLMNTIKVNKLAGVGLNNGDLSGILRFSFNSKAELANVMASRPDVYVNRDVSTVRITVPPFTPGCNIYGPPRATHYSFLSAAVEFDFESNRFQTSIAGSDSRRLDKQETEPITMGHSVSPNSRVPILVMFMIRFSMEKNGLLYPCSANQQPIRVIEVNNIPV